MALIKHVCMHLHGMTPAYIELFHYIEPYPSICCYLKLRHSALVLVLLGHKMTDNFIGISTVLKYAHTLTKSKLAFFKM